MWGVRISLEVACFMYVEGSNWIRAHSVEIHKHVYNITTSVFYYATLVRVGFILVGRMYQGNLTNRKTHSEPFQGEVVTHNLGRTDRNILPPTHDKHKKYWTLGVHVRIHSWEMCMWGMFMSWWSWRGVNKNHVCTRLKRNCNIREVSSYHVLYP